MPHNIGSQRNTPPPAVLAERGEGLAKEGPAWDPSGVLILLFSQGRLTPLLQVGGWTLPTCIFTVLTWVEKRKRGSERESVWVRLEHF